MLPEVKICGLTRPADSAAAVAAGARYVGVIFAESRRQVTLETAATVFAETLATAARRVGVFGDVTPDRLLDVAASLSLDVVQLHCGLRSDAVTQIEEAFPGEVWRVLRVDSTDPDFELHAAYAFHGAAGVVLDTFSPQHLGGTGTPFAWEKVASTIQAARRTTRLIVAGGLRAGNVGQAIAVLHPDVLDVSSGVEIAPGIKDPVAILEFVRAVREPPRPPTSVASA